LKCEGFRPSMRFYLALLLHDWEGNIRELEYVLETAKVKAKITRKKLEVDHIKFQKGRALNEVAVMSDDEVDRKVLSELSRVLRQRGFEKGRRRSRLHQEISKHLNVSKSTVSRKLEKFGLVPDQPESNDRVV
jgi:transcriptional regulator with PAS, ATPase and Fis domain